VDYRRATAHSAHKISALRSIAKHQRNNINKNDDNMWSKNFWRGGFSRGKVNMTLASREQCSRLQQSRRCRYWLFAAYTAAVGRTTFTTPKCCPLRLGISGPLSVPWAHPPKRHLDPFSRFCTAHKRAHKRDQQTDRHTHTYTDRGTPYVAIGHIWLLLRCDLIMFANCKEGTVK